MTHAAAVNVLIVEDDANLRLTLEDNLRDDGYMVHTSADARTAQQVWQTHPLDVIILDIMLPDGNGYEVCRQLRAEGHHARVLMLTARSLEDDVVQGFQAGADDYLTKPYRLRELLARVRALARRFAGPTQEVQRCAEFALDPAARTVIHATRGSIELTRTEFDVLLCLLRNRDRALSRDELLQSAWGPGVHVEERTVDNFIFSLKKKLGWTAQSAWRIRAVRGFGYRMEVDGL